MIAYHLQVALYSSLPSVSRNHLATPGNACILALHQLGSPQHLCCCCSAWHHGTRYASLDWFEWQRIFFEVNNINFQLSSHNPHLFILVEMFFCSPLIRTTWRKQCRLRTKLKGIASKLELCAICINHKSLLTSKNLVDLMKPGSDLYSMQTLKIMIQMHYYLYLVSLPKT